MRYLIFILLFPLLLFAQSHQNYTAYDLFNKFGIDSAAVTTPSWSPDDSLTVSNGIYWFATTDTTDTIISRTLTLERGGNDISVYVKADSVGDTLSTFVFFGYYRGPELGWSWNIVDTLSTDGAEAVYNVGEQSYGPYEVIEQIGIKIEERAAAWNKYAIRIRHFRWR